MKCHSRSYRGARPRKAAPLRARLLCPRPQASTWNGQKSGGVISFFRYLALLFTLFTCVACGAGRPASTSHAPVVTSVSRVVIPANGGQTIQVPRLMSDAITLWSPLNKKEQRLPATAFAMNVDMSANDIASWLPSTEHDTMRRYLYRLTHEQRALATRVLGRAEKYMPVVLAGVKRQGLPPEIACLPMVESAFEPQAVSPAGAAGLWQLMPDTARRFGLIVTKDVDERFDVQKSTEAATAYLASLYKLFGSWPLALAAYNCGEGTMQKAMGRANCTTLDGLTTYCRQDNLQYQPLKEETLRFVPQFVAAVTIMTRADSLGLAREPLLAVETMAKSAAATKVENHPGALVLSGQYDQSDRPASPPPRSMQLQ